MAARPGETRTSSRRLAERNLTLALAGQLLIDSVGSSLADATDDEAAPDTAVTSIELWDRAATGIPRPLVPATAEWVGEGQGWRASTYGNGRYLCEERANYVHWLDRLEGHLFGIGLPIPDAVLCRLAEAAWRSSRGERDVALMAARAASGQGLTTMIRLRLAVTIRDRGLGDSWGWKAAAGAMTGREMRLDPRTVLRGWFVERLGDRAARAHDRGASRRSGRRRTAAAPWPGRCAWPAAYPSPTA